MLTRDDFDAELQRIDDALAALQSISGAAQVDAAHASLLLMRQRIMALIEQYEQDLQSKSALSIQLPGGYTQQQILDAWYQYIDSQHTDPMVPPLIAASWRRCWARVNPLQDVLFPRLKQPYVLSSQVAGFELISISRPVIEDVFQCVANSGTCLLLLNSAGCVLDMIGDPEILRIIEGWGGGVGMILTEDAIGTNSMGLALVERMPVQVAGAEHYVRHFLGASGSACPFFVRLGNFF